MVPCLFRQGNRRGLPWLSGQSSVETRAGGRHNNGMLLRLPQLRLDLSHGFIVPPHRPYVDPYKIFSHHGTVWKRTAARVANAWLDCEISGSRRRFFPSAQARAKCCTPRQPITSTWSDCDRSCQVLPGRASDWKPGV
jgi:hypothetical protein